MNCAMGCSCGPFPILARAGAARQHPTSTAITAEFMVAKPAERCWPPQSCLCNAASNAYYPVGQQSYNPLCSHFPKLLVDALLTPILPCTRCCMHDRQPLLRTAHCPQGWHALTSLRSKRHAAYGLIVSDRLMTAAARHATDCNALGSAMYGTPSCEGITRGRALLCD